MNIGEQSEHTIKEFLEAWWSGLMWQVRETLLMTELPPATAEELYENAFGHTLRQIAAAAEGLIKRDQQTAGEVLEGVQQLCEWMWARPAMPSAYSIPEEFWTIGIGALALRAQLWAQGDELITPTEAEKLSGRSASALGQYASRHPGALTTYSDPGEPNPQRRTRYRRSQVAALKRTKKSFAVRGRRKLLK